MNTKQLVQSSANVIRVVNIKVGDLYKRFETEYEDRCYFGIVRNVHNDGENTVIECTEYKYTWSSIEASYKTITNKKDVAIFPCTLEEFKLEFAAAKEKLRKDIEQKQLEIETKEKQIIELERLISGETQKILSELDYKEVSQAEYDLKKLELAQL